MTWRENRYEYGRRMNSALDYIDRHLGEPLDLETVAGVAHFSPYHFHRLFAAWMDETLGDYLWRRRLERGALLLCNGDQAILAVALSVGFGSPEAFARAFKTRFGCTPTSWRKGAGERAQALLAEMQARRAQQVRKQDQVQRKLDQAGLGANGDDADSFNAWEAHMQVRIEQLSACKIAYQRYIGPYGAGVGDFWAQTFIPWLTASGLTGRSCYGIGHDDPSVTAPDKCRYDAAVEVPDDYVARGSAVLSSLPGGCYAVARFKGTGADIGDAWLTLLRDWLPSSGMQCDNRPCFEHYPADAHYDPVTQVFNCELCLPVRPA